MSSHYIAYGLKFHSEISLTGFSPVADDGTPSDVIVKYGELSLPPEALAQDSFVRLEQEAAYFYWRDTGKVRVRNGREIVVHLEPGAAEHLLRPVLLGSVLAVLLHQRDYLVLHTSAVALQSGGTPQVAVGFMGHSGAGKSTMATALHEAGHFALADDYIAVPVIPKAPETDSKSRGLPLIFPGFPQLKLRLPSAEAFGKDISSLPRWQTEEEEYLLRFQGITTTQPLPLAAIYLLEEAPEIRLETLPPDEALIRLANNSYCVRGLKAQGRADNFFQCAQMVERVPLFRLQRPRDFSRLREVIQTVERNHLNG